jgi:hypothetical protein
MLRISSVIVVLGVATTAQAEDVLVLSSGDPDLDDSVVEALTVAGHSVAVGPQYFDFDGTFGLAGVGTVHLQPNANWNAGDMPEAGQQQLIDFVQAGGGVVTCEWAEWKAYLQGSFQDLKALLPAETSTFTSTAETTYTKATADATLNAGLPDAFTFPETSYSGTESLLVARQSATVYYTSSTALDGVVGWGVGDGRVLSISSVAGISSVEDPSFGHLLANAMTWAGVGSVCVADCNGNGSLNILDFVCFQQKFQAGDDSADINGDGSLNILDFVAFQQAFQAGCP